MRPFYHNYWKWLKLVKHLFLSKQNSDVAWVNKDRMMKKGLLYISLMLFICVTRISTAEIYKWTDVNGKVHYSDTAPTDNKPEIINQQHLNSRASSYSETEILTSTTNSSVDQQSQSLVMYTTSTCGYCAKARRYFAEKGIKFTEKNIETSQKYHKEFKRIGGKGVPVILWGNNKMNGFSVPKFEKFYQQSA